MSPFEFACFCVILSCMTVALACIALILGGLLRAVNAGLVGYAMDRLADQLPYIKPKENRR